MAIQNERKLKILLERHQPGTVCLASWLEQQGISRNLLKYYLRSGWLEPIGRGAFKKPGDDISWVGALHALVEQAGIPVHVGGITALSTQGAGHYLRVGRDRVCLFSPLGVLLPAWFRRYDWGVDIEHIRTHFLPQNVGIGARFQTKLDNSSGFIIGKYSDTERAMLECLYMTPDKQDLVESYQVMEGLVNLRPQVVQQLLEVCSSVKVKRLFLYMAEKAGHQWLPFVDLSEINVGKGDRRIGKKGVYVAKYHISLPKELVSL